MIRFDLHSIHSYQQQEHELEHSTTVSIASSRRSAGNSHQSHGSGGGGVGSGTHLLHQRYLREQLRATLVPSTSKAALLESYEQQRRRFMEHSSCDDPSLVHLSSARDLSAPISARSTTSNDSYTSTGDLSVKRDAALSASLSAIAERMEALQRQRTERRQHASVSRGSTPIPSGVMRTPISP